MAVGAIFGAVNTMYAAVASRAPEIAVLLTLGFRPRSILASFLAESAVIAAIGGVIGCLLALPMNGIVTSTTNWANFSEIAFSFRVTPGLLLAGLDLRRGDGDAGRVLPGAAGVEGAGGAGDTVASARRRTGGERSKALARAPERDRRGAQRTPVRRNSSRNHADSTYQSHAGSPRNGMIPDRASSMRSHL